MASQHRAGDQVLVAIREPLRHHGPEILTPGTITTDQQLQFTPPDTTTPEQIELSRLGDNHYVVHTTTSGRAWAIKAFTIDSPAHLSWQIAQLQIQITQLSDARPIHDRDTANRLARYVSALQQLVRRLTLTAPATATTTTAA